MTIFVFRSRGAGEPYGRFSMLGHVTDLTPGVVVEDVQHTGSLGVLTNLRDPLAPSGDNAANQVVAWLNRRIAQLKPTDSFIILGYSLGAVGVTRWLKQYSPGVAKCLMVGNIANPSRNETTSYGMPYSPGASGIYSTQGTGVALSTIGSPVPLVEIANPGDVMTTCYKASPLHAFAGPVMAFSFANPTDLIADLRDDVEEVLRSLVTNWWDRHWWTWPGDLHAYMTHSHTTDYALKMWRDSAGKPVSGIDLLARQINWRVSRAKAA